MVLWMISLLVIVHVTSEDDTVVQHQAACRADFLLLTSSFPLPTLLIVETAIVDVTQSAHLLDPFL
jgi:hypothetical protein